MKAEIIHIDGPDKTGKDSIRREVVKSGKGSYLVYVRSFLSQIVYGRIYNRNIFYCDFVFAVVREVTYNAE